MCTTTIIDASLFGWYTGDTLTQSATSIRNWISGGHGVVAYTREEQFGRELRKCRKMYSLFENYRREGRAFLVPKEKLQQADDQIDEREIKSDDPHILSLALASEALVLCTDDGDLGSDFKNKDLLPKVGRKKRAIYPYEDDQKARNTFLANRKCPRV